MIEIRPARNFTRNSRVAGGLAAEPVAESKSFVQLWGEFARPRVSPGPSLEGGAYTQGIRRSSWSKSSRPREFRLGVCGPRIVCSRRGFSPTTRRKRGLPGGFGPCRVTIRGGDGPTRLSRFLSEPSTTSAVVPSVRPWPVIFSSRFPAGSHKTSQRSSGPRALLLFHHGGRSSKSARWHDDGCLGRSNCRTT